MTNTALRVLLVSFIAVLTSFAVASCSAPRSRVPEAPAGERTDEIVAGVTQQLLASIKDIGRGSDWFVAYVGVENKSAADLGELKADIDASVSGVLVRSKLFRNISFETVKAAMQASDVRRPSELSLKEPLERFVKVLREEGRPPAYIVFGELTSAKMEGDKRRFRLRLQMVQASDGEVMADENATVTPDI